MKGQRGTRAAVFLDRDGVLVVPDFRDGRSYAPKTLDAFVIHEDAEPSLSRLKAGGFLLVVVTNQPDVGAGITGQDELDEMHRRLRASMPVDDIEVCTHTNAQHCSCRKPKPGMLLRAAERHGIDLSRSYMVGDRASDASAGSAAGCRTAFLDLSYTAEEPPTDVDFRATSLPEIADWILAQGASTTMVL